MRDAKRQTCALSGLSVALALSLAVVSDRAFAQDEETGSDLTSGRGWSITVKPYIWALSLDGNATIRGLNADVDHSFSEILDELSVAAMGYIDVRTDRFGVFINPLFARMESEENGRFFDTDVTSDMALVTAGAFYKVGEIGLGRTASGFQRSIAIEPYAGVRWTYLRLELDIDGPVDRLSRQFDQSQNWLDPVVGLRTFVSLGENFQISVAGDVGGFANNDVDEAWNISAFLSYRTELFGAAANLGFGYRALHQDYDDGDGFGWDVTMHGPAIGASFRF